MDNLTHSLLGAALAKTRLGRASPLATPALIIAANLPDIDLLAWLFGGKAAYLLHHRGITHSVLGIALEIVLLFLLLRWIERRRAGSHPRAVHVDRGLGVAILVGLISHVLLDSLNSYGLRPWLPFDGTWYYGDLVFVVEPWMWLIFGAAACLPGPHSRAGDVTYALLALGCQS
jgi:inner membrane protein